jgi:hypothetical protein
MNFLDYSNWKRSYITIIRNEQSWIRGMFMVGYFLHFVTARGCAPIYLDLTLKVWTNFYKTKPLFLLYSAKEVAPLPA